jgi:hypothetical protein
MDSIYEHACEKPKECNYNKQEWKYVTQYGLLTIPKEFFANVTQGFES